MPFSQFDASTKAGRRHIPGNWRTKTGFLYATLCRNTYTKVGSSRNPKARFTESTRLRYGQKGYMLRSPNGKEFWCPAYRMIVSGPYGNYPALEKRLHKILAPLRAHTENPCERYYLPRVVVSVLREAFASQFSPESIRNLKEAVTQAA